MNFLVNIVLIAVIVLFAYELYKNGWNPQKAFAGIGVLLLAAVQWLGHLIHLPGVGQ